MKTTWMWLASAAVALTAAPIQAAVHASVEVDEPQITVTDLDPKDGIDAAWMLGGYRAPLFHFALHPAPTSDEAYGDGRLDIFDGRVAGSAWVPQSGFFAARDLYLPSFTVTATPLTRVSVQVPYRLYRAIDVVPPFGAETPDALASLELQLVAINNLRLDPDSGDLLYDELSFARDYVELGSPYGEPAMPGERRIKDSLQVSFDNASASDAVFAFRAELVAFGHTGNAVAGVPEPGSVAMWLMGFAVVAWRMGRRPG